tara:strand:- start:95 stop:304 length:210 start_codon:yes stop_codon:yes gene_type:complete
MWAAIVLACSVEFDTCKNLANPDVYTSLDVCLNSLAEGFQAAEGNGWTVMNYTCLDWKTKDLKIDMNNL